MNLPRVTSKNAEDISIDKAEFKSTAINGKYYTNYKIRISKSQCNDYKNSRSNNIILIEQSIPLVYSHNPLCIIINIVKNCMMQNSSS